MATFELSKKGYKNGRRPFTAILYELQPPECVIDDVGTKFNKNGITFLEEYCSDKLESIKDMSATVEFLDEERTEICGHGMTGVDSEDGMPVFDDATVVGHFTEGFIKDVEINGEIKRCVLGKGFLDEMRYKGFVDKLETALNNGNSIDGSIEIYRTEPNENIVYKKGWLPKGRIPTEFTHSGWSFVLSPADVTSSIVELNEDKEDKEIMTEQEIMLAVEKALDKTTELNEKITELNSQIEEKDVALAEINEAKEAVEKTVAEKDATIEELNAKIATLTDEVNECKKKELCSALDEKLSTYTEDEKKVAEVEINEYKADPMNKSVDAIVSKICVGIVEAQKAEASKIIAEQNSVKEDVVDIFSEMCSVEDKAEEDVNIF